MATQSKSFTHPEKTGVLYLVATPIGHLADITFRAVETLKSVSVIACEDTRVSRVLCQHYGIATPLFAYHDHNAEAALPQLLARIEAGESIALISDAGTPLISDPGYRLVNKVVETGGRVVPIPGASSLVTAACASGLPTDRLHFSGFLPAKVQARKQALHHLSTIDATLIVFESNHRIAETLQDACEVLGEARRAVVAREMTKHFEEFRRGTLAELAEHYKNQLQVKGEIVLLLAPPEAVVTPLSRFRPLLEALLPHYPVKQATALLAETLEVSRKDLYTLSLAIKGGN